MRGRVLLFGRPCWPSVAAAGAVLGIGMLTAVPARAGWEHPYGDSANTGFAAVVTKPAGAGSVSVPGLGTFAPGAGPVIAADGTVYLGTMEGKLIALRADGSPYWTRQLPGRQGIMTPPVVGTDGSVYVVGVSHKIDHRGGETTPKSIYEATLYKFTGSGGMIGNGTAFPENQHIAQPYIYGPQNTGAPNIWRYGNDEVVMVPVVYPTVGGKDLHLLAFAAAGGVMADTVVSYWGGSDVTAGGDYLFLPIDFVHGVLPPPAQPPLPRAAIFTNPQGGTPFIVVSNPYHDDIVGFTFCVGASPPCSPATGFTARFRTHHRPRVMWSSPTILPDMHSVVGTDDGVVFSGPNMLNLALVTGVGGTYGAPTRTVDGLVVIVKKSGGMAVLRDGIIDSQSTLLGGSIVPAAASCTNVFVSTTDGLLTYDAAARVQLLKFPWVGGGIWPLAIGPTGRVYAIASNILFIFPPPPQGTGITRPDVQLSCGQRPTIGGSVGVAPADPAAPTPEQAPTPKSN